MNSEFRKSFQDFLSQHYNSKILAVSHSRPDLDALCSSYIVSKQSPNWEFAFQDQPGFDLGPMLSELGVNPPLVSEINLGDYDGLAVVDTNTTMLCPCASEKNVMLLVDHHNPSTKDISATVEIIDPSSRSTVELLYRLLDIDSQDDDVLLSIAVGIISDTARFKSATSSTFSAFSDVFSRIDKSYDDLLSLAYPRMPADASNSIIVGLDRARYVWEKGNLIGMSIINSNESVLASLLSEFCDYSFVAGLREDGTRVSARANIHSKVDLSSVMRKAFVSIGGSGGGHPKAAGGKILGLKDPEEALSACLNTLKKFL